VEKVAILCRHVLERVPKSDLCDQYQIQPSMLCNWHKPFFDTGDAAFERTRSAPEKHQKRRIAALQDELQRRNEVVAEPVEEHVKFREVLGELQPAPEFLTMSRENRARSMESRTTDHPKRRGSSSPE
jgi:transposase